MNNKQESILYLTDQAGKYYTSQLIGTIAIFLFVGALYYYPYQSWQFELCLALAVVLSIADFFIAFRIKCPKCGSRWLWQALKTPVGDKGLSKFRSQKVCPTCGFSGEAGP